jgi:hypothetical protein
MGSTESLVIDLDQEARPRFAKMQLNCRLGVQCETRLHLGVAYEDFFGHK